MCHVQDHFVCRTDSQFHHPQGHWPRTGFPAEGGLGKAIGLLSAPGGAPSRRVETPRTQERAGKRELVQLLGDELSVGCVGERPITSVVTQSQYPLLLVTV